MTISGTLYNFATVFGGATYGEVISGESWFAGGGGGGVNQSSALWYWWIWWRWYWW